MASCDLSTRKCKPCEGGVPPLAPEEIRGFLQELPGWELVAQEAGKEISRTYQFRNHYQVMAFVNAVAWISHQEDHHPDLEVGFNKCRVRYSTHAIGGLSENDFICAAKVDGLLQATS